MARRYSAGVATPAPVTAAAYATIAAPAGGRTRILEIHCFNNAATAGSIGIYRATNTFVATTNTLLQADDPNDQAGVTNIGTAWSTAPTIGSNVAFRRVMFGASIGIGIIWQFENLICGPAGTTGLVIWNYGGTTGGVQQLVVVADANG